MSIATQLIEKQPQSYRDDSAHPWAAGLGLDVVDRIKQLEDELADAKDDYYRLWETHLKVVFEANQTITQLAMLRAAIDQRFGRDALARAIHAEAHS